MNKLQMMTIICMFLLQCSIFESCTNSTVKEEEEETSIEAMRDIYVPIGIIGEDSVAYIENTIYQSPISAKTFLSLAKVHSIEGTMVNYNNYELAEKDPENADAFIANHQDSCAVRLANRFMRMRDLAYENGDAMDMLQWAVAVNAVLDTFRFEMPELNRDSTLFEITRVITKFSSSSQHEMYIKYYFDAAIDYYLTIESYRKWLEEVSKKLQHLFLEEYVAWFQLNNERYAFWTDVSYPQAWYNINWMEIKHYYSCLARNRRAELAIERDIILDGKPYHQLGETVTSKQWEDWLKDNTLCNIQDLCPLMIPDPSFFKRKIEELSDAFFRWLEARRAIAAALPDEQKESYNCLTEDIYSRVVGKLEWIVPFEKLGY